MSDGEIVNDLKTKEDWLRQELRANRTVMTSILQWGVGILAAVQLNLYYLRLDVFNHLVTVHKLKEDELLPLSRWIMGTFFLLLLAWIFSTYMRRAVDRHSDYRRQLKGMAPSYSGIVEAIPIGGRLAKMYYLLFYAFPAIDIVVWALFYAGEKLSITLPW